jgi:hypothetical protein
MIATVHQYCACDHHKDAHTILAGCEALVSIKADGTPVRCQCRHLMLPVVKVPEAVGG